MDKWTDKYQEKLEQLQNAFDFADSYTLDDGTNLTGYHWLDDGGVLLTYTDEEGDEFEATLSFADIESAAFAPYPGNLVTFGSGEDTLSLFFWKRQPYPVSDAPTSTNQAQ